MMELFSTRHSWGLTFEVVNDHNLVVYAGSELQCSTYVALRQLGYDTIKAAAIVDMRP
jgi:hypothetical protein